MFPWHACTDTLPSKAKLQQRKTTTDSLCPIFLFEDETPGHILWLCPFDRDVWLLGLRVIKKIAITKTYFWNVVDYLWNRLPQSKLVLFAIVARFICFWRNSFIHEQRFQAPASVYRQFVQAHEDFLRSLHISFVTRLGVAPVTSHWTAPRPNWKKLNWDVAIKTYFSKIGIGMILQDCHGMVLVSLRKALNYLVLNCWSYGTIGSCKLLLWFWFEFYRTWRWLFYGWSSYYISGAYYKRTACLISDYRQLLSSIFWKI